MGLAVLGLCAALAVHAGAAAPADAERLFRDYLVTPQSLRPAVEALTSPEARDAFGKQVADSFDRWPLKEAAAFTLEASAALYLNDPDLSAKLLELGCKRLRRGPPTRFERLWHHAAAADLHGPLRLNKYPRSRRGLEPHLRHALGRFQDDGALRFAFGLFYERSIHDYLHVLGPSMQCVNCESWMMPGIMRMLDRLGSIWEQLQKQPDWREEATLRLGLARYHRGRVEDALALWAEIAKVSTDPSRQYLAALFSGRARHGRGDAHGARQEYSRALALRPSAQSAIAGLISVYFETGDIVEAEKLAVHALTQPDDYEDPWLRYLSGDFDQWNSRIALVRGAMR